jgi:probable rRNA maturation factor
MTVEVFAADEQTDFPVDTLRWVRLAEAVLADEGVQGDTELSMLFVDETSIADLNKRFLGKDGPTDVLAFPIDEEPAESGRSPDSGGSGPGFTGDPEEAPTLLGDVVICPTVAHRNAPDHAGTFEDEIALLVVHGVLHLLGLDHMDDEEAEEMEAKERALLAKHHAPAAPVDEAEIATPAAPPSPAAVEAGDTAAPSVRAAAAPAAQDGDATGDTDLPGDTDPPGDGAPTAGGVP